MLHRLQLSLRFFPLVAIVHTAPYVDICDITFVGRLSPKFHVTSLPPPFFVKPELRDLYEHRHHGRRRPWPLYRRPRLEDTRSQATRLLPTPWAAPHPLGSIKFIQGGEMKSISYLGDLRGLLLPHHGATAMASTVANAWKMPVL